MIKIFDLSRKIDNRRNLIESTFHRVLTSGQLILGPEVLKFEKAFASYAESKFCIGVGNGTDALYLSLAALNLKPESVVAVSANNGFYASSAINLIGCKVKYLDVDLETSNISLEIIKEAGKIDVLVVTHLYGLAVEKMSEIAKYCSNNQIRLIEDCAQATGAIVDGKKAGSWGDIGCFSFYPTKNLGALGDGGAVVTNSEPLANSLRQLREYGWSEKYTVKKRGGINSRLDELQAAILLEFLPLLDKDNQRRREIANQYLSSIDNLEIILPRKADLNYVAHLFVVQCSARERLIEFLKENEISSAIHYPISDYNQPLNYPAKEILPNTEFLQNRILTIPCYPELKETEVEKIIFVLNKFKSS